MAKTHSTVQGNTYAHNRSTATKLASCPMSAKPGPNSYAIEATGDCLLPDYGPGDLMVCDPDQEPREGDLVAVWWKDGIDLPSVKFLNADLPPKEWWALTGGNVLLSIHVRMLNPPKCLQAPLSRVDAVHKVIHVIKAA